MTINKVLFPIFTVTVIIVTVIGIKIMNNYQSIPTLYMFELPEPDSLDPLLADKAGNLRLARMLYATAVEINYDGSLVSDVLETFSYDQSKSIIILTRKEGRKYLNGEEITSDDIAFSFSRMLFTRPDFPVLKYIKGAAQWLKQPSPLESYPEGIQIRGNQITIVFERKLKNPLYRLSLEIFSIIQKKSVDLKANKLASEPSPSGFYKLTKKENSEYTLEKFKSTRETYGYEGPRLVKLKYKSSLENELKHLNDNTIIFGTDAKLYEKEFSEIRERLSFVNLPATYFSALNINPSFKLFRKRECRQRVAHTFRKKIYASLPSAGPTNSYFPATLPGYLEDSKFETFKNDSCIINGEIDLYVMNPNQLSLQEKLLFDTLLEVGITKINLVSHGGRAADYFAEGKSALHLASSGFWTFDPIGDLKMYFAPNMHLSKKHMWSDPDFMKLWSSIDENEDGGSQLEEKLFKINKYVHNDAKFNVYVHSRRFFAALSSEFIRPFPQLLTSPAPWQLFNAK